MNKGCHRKGKSSGPIPFRSGIILLPPLGAWSGMGGGGREKRWNPESSTGPVLEGVAGEDERWKNVSIRVVNNRGGDGCYGDRDTPDLLLSDGSKKENIIHQTVWATGGHESRIKYLLLTASIILGKAIPNMMSRPGYTYFSPNWPYHVTHIGCKGPCTLKLSENTSFSNFENGCKCKSVNFVASTA